MNDYLPFLREIDSERREGLAVLALRSASAYGAAALLANPDEAWAPVLEPARELLGIHDADLLRAWPASYLVQRRDVCQRARSTAFGHLVLASEASDPWDASAAPRIGELARLLAIRERDNEVAYRGYWLAVLERKLASGPDDGRGSDARGESWAVAVSLLQSSPAGLPGQDAIVRIRQILGELLKFRREA